MEQAQCKGMLACEEGAAPCCTPLSLGAARFMSNTLLQGGHRTLGDDVEAIPSFSHFALDLGGKEESGRTAERERRDGWDSCIIKAQMLGLSTATLGWSRCLQRTQSLFCIFSFFFPFFSPTKSFSRTWRRKENLKAIIFCWLFDASLLQCCARDGDRAGVLCPPFSCPCGLAGAVP